VERVIGPDEQPEFATIEPATPDEERRFARGELVSGEHVPLINYLAEQRLVRTLRDAETRRRPAHRDLRPRLLRR